MSNEALQQRFRPADNVVFRELDGEAIILHLDSGTYFGLDGVGTSIWRRLERQESVGVVVDALVGEFEVDAPRARLDVEQLITQLVDKGLMVADEGPTA